MKKIQQVDLFYEALRVVLGIIIAYLVCLLIIVMITGLDGARDAIYNFAVGPFTSPRRFAQVLSRWGPYMLTGVGMCFVYASGRFSLISEGIINIAPIPILLIMFASNSFMADMPKIVNILLILITCVITGVLVSMIPAVGREKWGANETVTSIVLNTVCLFLALSVLRNFIADRSMSFLASPAYPENMRFARYLGNSNLHQGIWVAIIGVIIGCVLFYFTRAGLNIRITGSNSSFAKYAGINIGITAFLGQIIGGGFAGLASAIEVFGTYNQYYLLNLTNIGMDGLIIAVMARKHPIFVPFTAFVLSYIRTAAAVLNTNTNIPIELVDILSAVIILFVAAEHFLSKSREKSIIKVSRANAVKEA